MGKLVACRLGNVRKLIHFGAQNILERRFTLGGNNFIHLRATTLLKTFHLVEQLLLRILIPHIVANGRHQHGADVLCCVGQRGVRAGGNAFHALGTVLGDVNRRLAASDIFALRRATGRPHYPQACQRASRLVVAKVITKFIVKHPKRLERVALLLLGHRAAWAAATSAASSIGHLNLSSVVWRQQRIAHTRGVGVLNFTILNFCHALEAADHYLHVRLHDLIAKAAKLFLIRLVHDVVVFLLGYIVVL